MVPFWCHEKEKPHCYAVFLHMEQMSGIEPPCPPWQGGVLPLNYICMAVAMGLEGGVLPLNYICMAVAMGLEPTTSSVTGRRSNQLN